MIVDPSYRGDSVICPRCHDMMEPTVSAQVIQGRVRQLLWWRCLSGDHVSVSLPLPEQMRQPMPGHTSERSTT